MASVPDAVLPAPAASRNAGILLFFAALVAFATFDAGSKHMLERYPAPFLNVMRYLAVIVLALYMLWRHAPGLRLRDTPEKPLLVLRGLTLATVATCFMTALIWMPLSEATAIYFTSPLIMVALSPWLLRERVRPVQWIAVAVGFAGMLLIVRPGADLPLLGTLLMAVSAVCYAIFQVLTRKLSGKVPGPVQYAYTAIICLIVTALPAPFFLPDPWPGPADATLIIALGVCSGLAQVLLIAAFQRVSAATLAPLNYFQLLLAVLFSTFWFQRPPDAMALAGMGLIMASGVFLALRRAA
ncbi:MULTISPECIES: DMT family transporter [Achromobacter]|uniref:DMT family transporter n=1 Tax=Achromobacter spanius TaxID=217203 RepID=A0ABY8GV97_9BURK|nr:MULTISPECIES: DMT family transporter [Achromobacter]WAI82328.1 DMT family transporter [Achromobacter spanius]WEX92415.1 DMT family transporter [Achromobacter sp. SS2-2022]WFP08434.1 DMT family transporter [Achromobacter spanius]